MFLESAHKMGENSKGGASIRRLGVSYKCPGNDWILVKLFGVTYKHWMKVCDLPMLAKEKLDCWHRKQKADEVRKRS